MITFEKLHTKNLLLILLHITIFSSMSTVFNHRIQAQENDLPQILSAKYLINRDIYICTRRAGGPGKILPNVVYSNALYQKSLLPEDKNLQGSSTSLVNWVSVNPIGLFYARTNNNYISGRTNSIAFHPTNSNIFYIGAAQGGVWKTTDGGITWQVLTDGLPNIASGDIEVDQSNPNILYYGTGELNFAIDCHYGNGIYKSTDAGSSWNQIATNSIASYISKILIDPTNSNILYVAGDGSCAKSTNAGANWTTLTGGANCTSMIMDPTNTQILYIACGGYYGTTIMKTTTGGTYWNIMATGIPSNGRGRIALAISNINPSVLYASIAH